MSQNKITDQAYVTLATNESYGLGALTLGYSLQESGTNRILVCMVTKNLSGPVRDELEKLYEVVEVDVMDSNDSGNLALLQRPDLGVTFTKLHCWRLVQFTKCVFLDADTFVLKNIDDLFDREELSASPDIGWPDCFNSGVFVFSPSHDTYFKLFDVALQKGSYDGGDQGLLNSFFSDWATKDIKYHLSFLYNVVANDFYTYLPALNRYGKDAKVVHFIGATKPWMTASSSVSSNTHYSTFIQTWWDMFYRRHSTNQSQKLLERLQACGGGGGDLFCSGDRKALWEQGRMDYTGVDSFESIQRQIASKMNFKDDQGSSTHVSRPAFKVQTSTPSQTPSGASIKTSSGSPIKTEAHRPSLSPSHKPKSPTITVVTKARLGQ